MPEVRDRRPAVGQGVPQRRHPAAAPARRRPIRPAPRGRPSPPVPDSAGFGPSGPASEPLAIDRTFVRPDPPQSAVKTDPENPAASRNPPVPGLQDDEPSAPSVSV